MTAALSQKYNLGPVKPWVQNAAYILGPMFGIKTIYGWRKTDPFPDHPSGHALDFMTPNKAAGDKLAAYAVQNYKALGIKYIIWYRRYWTPDGGWVPYTQAGEPPHTDHVHITFLDTPGTATAGPTPKGLTDVGSTATLTASSTVDDTCAWSFSFPVAGATCLMTKTQLRQFTGVGLMVGGVVLGVVGLVLLVAYGLGKTDAAKAIPAVARFL